MATAPAIVRFVGGSVPDALATTRRMHEITLGENPRWSVPALDFQGVPTGIDVTRVLAGPASCRRSTPAWPASRPAWARSAPAWATPPAEIFPKALALAGLEDSGTRRLNAGSGWRRPSWEPPFGW